VSRTIVSSKYQVVIPKDIREESGLKKGQTFEVMSKGGVIALVPDQPLSELKGFAKDVRPAGLREKKDRF
jgi:AbrB family looped-hinge helix DNA binding protein